MKFIAASARNYGELRSHSTRAYREPTAQILSTTGSLTTTCLQNGGNRPFEYGVITLLGTAAMYGPLIRVVGAQSTLVIDAVALLSGVSCAGRQATPHPVSDFRNQVPRQTHFPECDQPSKLNKSIYIVPP
jgi:hypothetical protein